MIRSLALSLFLLFSKSLTAQVGHYYVSHYAHSDQATALSFDIAQDPNGFLYTATRTGLKQFDGRTWRTIKSASATYTLCTDAEGNVYAAGENGIGIVTTTLDFSLAVTPLYSRKNIDFFESLLTKERIIFISEQVLTAINTTTKKADTLSLPTGEEGFATLFELFGIAYTSTLSGNTYKIDELKLSKTDLRTESPVVFSAGYNDNYVLLTSNQELYLFAKNGLKKIQLEDAAYIQSSVIVNGAWVNQQLIALGTLHGGVVFVNPNTGKTEEIINYFSGLPDNEIFCMKRDAEGNIWVGHEYGYSCIAPGLPFRTFNHYAGLQGNVLSARSFQGKLYVGTSVGLFVLEKENQYGEEVFYVDGKKALKAGNESIIQPQQESKKKGFFRFLKRKTTQANSETNTTAKEQAPTTGKIRQTRKVIIGSTYAFKKIEGISSKVDKIEVDKGYLYVAGLAGLFKVEASKATLLVQEPIEVLIRSEQNNLIGATNNNRIFSSKGSEQTIYKDDLHDEISSITEQGENLWITGTKTIYQLQVNGSVQSFPFTNPTHDQTASIQHNNSAVFVNSFGFYTVANGAVRVIDSLGKPSQFFATEGTLLYKHNDEWKSMGATVDTKNFKYLNIFSNIRHIEIDAQSKTLWIVTNNNELYRFYTDRIVPKTADYPLLVRSVHNSQNYFQPNQSVYKVEQSEGELMIEIVQATFTSGQGAQYRFRLEGLEEDKWSDWSGTNQLSFPYLPLGKYVLKLQTRDVLGNVNEMKPIELVVEPPFWKTPWFYAMQFSIFAVLVVLSIRLQALNKRYRFLAQLLSALTIVLLITSIQTTFTTYLTTSSPAIDFTIQVGIALLVLPVESFLRKFMFNSGTSNKLSRFISPTLKRKESEQL
jgi:ligand-binding sensor domain-containing protein